jgi:hypothetical protein
MKRKKVEKEKDVKKRDLRKKISEEVECENE